MKLRVILALAALIGGAILAPQPAAWGVAAEYGRDVVTYPTHAGLALACVVYALLLRLARRFSRYDQLLWLVVMGGVIIVGMFVRWRLSFPSGDALWAWRMMVWHFYTACQPIVIWQMCQEWNERRNAARYRTKAGP